MTNSESPRVISRIVRQAPYEDLQRKPYYQPFSLNIIPEITFYFTPEVYPGNAPQGTDSHYHYSSEIVNIFDEIFKDNASSIYIANRKGIYFDQQISNAEYIRIASEIDANIALSRFAIVAYSLAYLLQASGKGTISLSLAPKLEQILIKNNPYGLNIRPEVFANARKIYEMALNGEFSPESLLNVINDTKVLDANLVMIDELFSLKNIFGFIGYVFYQVTGEKLNYSNQYVSSYMSRLQEVLEYAGDDAISRISPEEQALVAHRAQVNAAYQPKSKHLELDMFPDFTQASVPVSTGSITPRVVERLTEVPPLEASVATVATNTPVTPPASTVATDVASAVTATTATSSASATTTKDSVLSDVDLAASLIAAHEQQQATRSYAVNSSTVKTSHTIYDTAASTVDELEEYGYASYGDIVDQVPVDSENADVALNAIYDEGVSPSESLADTTVAKQVIAKSQLSPQELLKLAQDTKVSVTASSMPTSSDNTVTPSLKLKSPPEVSTTRVVSTTSSVVTLTDTLRDATATPTGVTNIAEVTATVGTTSDTTPRVDENYVATVDPSTISLSLKPQTTSVASSLASTASPTTDVDSVINITDVSTSSELTLDPSSELELLTEIVDEPVTDQSTTVTTEVSHPVNTTSTAKSITTGSLKLPRYDQEHLAVVQFPTELDAVATSPEELANLPQETERDASDFNDLEDYNLTKLVPDAPLSSFHQSVGDTAPASGLVTNLSETYIRDSNSSTTTDDEIIAVAEELEIPVTDESLARVEAVELDPVAVVSTTTTVDHDTDTATIVTDDVTSTSITTDANLNNDTSIDEDIDSNTASNVDSKTDLVASDGALALSIQVSYLDDAITPELNSNIPVITTAASLAEQVQASSGATYRLQSPVELTAEYTDSELLEQVTGYSLAELQQLDLEAVIQLAQEYELTLDPPVEHTDLTADTDLGFNDILDAHDLVTQTRQTIEQYTIDVDGKLVTIPATNATINIDIDSNISNLIVSEDRASEAQSLQQESASPQSEASAVPTALTLPTSTAQYLETSFSQLSHKLGLDTPDPMHDQAIPLNQRLKLMQGNLHLLADHGRHQGSGLIGRATAELTPKPANQLYQDSIQRQQQYVRHHHDAQVAVPDIAIPASRKALYKQAKRLLQQVLELRKRELTAISSNASSTTTGLSH